VNDKECVAVEAADGGKLIVNVPRVRSLHVRSFSMKRADHLIHFPQKKFHFSCIFVEIVGSVLDNTTLDFIRCINMGDSLGEAS